MRVTGERVAGAARRVTRAPLKEGRHSSHATGGAVRASWEWWPRMIPRHQVGAREERLARRFTPNSWLDATEAALLLIVGRSFDCADFDRDALLAFGCSLLHVGVRWRRVDAAAAQVVAHGAEENSGGDTDGGGGGDDGGCQVGGGGGVGGDEGRQRWRRRRCDEL
eukprot:6193699-Pleurochrysis_carterae.AAC.3